MGEAVRETARSEGAENLDNIDEVRCVMSRGRRGGCKDGMKQGALL